MHQARVKSWPSEQNTLLFSANLAVKTRLLLNRKYEKNPVNICTVLKRCQIKKIKVVFFFFALKSEIVGITEKKVKETASSFFRNTDMYSKVTSFP